MAVQRTDDPRGFPLCARSYGRIGWKRALLHVKHGTGAFTWRNAHKSAGTSADGNHDRSPRLRIFPMLIHIGIAALPPKSSWLLYSATSKEKWGFSPQRVPTSHWSCCVNVTSPEKSKGALFLDYGPFPKLLPPLFICLLLITSGGCQFNGFAQCTTLTCWCSLNVMAFLKTSSYCGCS